MIDDQALLPQDDYGQVSDDFDPDNPDSYGDVDQMMEAVTGNIPQPGKAYSISDDVENDEEDR